MTDKTPAGIPTNRPEDPVDPTKNVLDLVRAAVQRIDDLRIVDKELILGVFDAEKTHIREIMNLERQHATELRDAEAKRIDAIRAVDVGAVGVAAERAAASASVLAATVTTSAEQLRSLVQTQAVSVATAQQQLIEPIMTRLAAMERTQYEGVGRERIADPAMAQLMADVKDLRASQSSGAGAQQGQVDYRAQQRQSQAGIIAVIGIAVTVFLAILTLIGFVIARM